MFGTRTPAKRDVWSDVHDALRNNRTVSKADLEEALKANNALIPEDNPTSSHKGFMAMRIPHELAKYNSPSSLPEDTEVMTDDKYWAYHSEDYYKGKYRPSTTTVTRDLKNYSRVNHYHDLRVAENASRDGTKIGRVAYNPSSKLLPHNNGEQPGSRTSNSPYH
jgi:hypothetical protein